MITVTTKLRATEGRDQELEAALRALCAQTGAAPGCERSEMARSAHDACRFLLLCCFADEAAQAANSNSEAYAQALPPVMECLAELPEIEIYEDL